MDIYQVVNPPGTYKKCGLWAVLIGLYLSGCDHIDAIFDAILAWMTNDCGRFLLVRETGYPSTKMFSFPDGNYLNMGEIFIGRQEGVSGAMIEEEGFLNTDEGRTVQLFFNVADAFKVTIQVYEIFRIDYDNGTAEVCPGVRCQIGDGETIIRIGRLNQGDHFYTLVPIGTVDQIVIYETPQVTQTWISAYDAYLKSFKNYKEPVNQQLQIDSDHELALQIARLEG